MVFFEGEYLKTVHLWLYVEPFLSYSMSKISRPWNPG